MCCLIIKHLLIPFENRINIKPVDLLNVIYAPLYGSYGTERALLLSLML